MRYLIKSSLIKVLVNLLVVFSITFSQITPAVLAANESETDVIIRKEAVTEEGTRIPKILENRNCVDNFCLYLPLIIRGYVPSPSNGPDLSITNSDNGVSVNFGGSITYTLGYQNNGTKPASGVIITETLPQYTFLSDSAGWQQVGMTSQYTHQVGNLAVGASGQATFKVTVSNSLPGSVTSIQNVVNIHDNGSQGSDPNTSNNTAWDNTPINTTIDLLIEKTADHSSVIPSEEITYTLSYANIGTASASGVLITETLPANTVFVPSDSSSGWQHVGISNQYTLYIGNLAAGSSDIARFVVMVNNDVPSGTASIDNTVAISDDGTHGIDGNANNNTVTTSSILTAQLDLSVTKTTAISEIAPGGQINYSISYTNVGSLLSSGVVLKENIPGNTVFNAEQSATGWQQVGTTNQYIFSVGTLNPGEQGTTTFVMDLESTFPAGVNSNY